MGIGDPEPFLDLLDTAVGLLGDMDAELEEIDHGTTLMIDGASAQSE